MSLKDQITEDMKSAMRAKEADRLGTIRLLLAAIWPRTTGLGSRRAKSSKRGTISADTLPPSPRNRTVQ